MAAKKNFGGLDLFRIAAACLVVAIHTSPLETVSPEGDFFLTRILARVAVPFFFMVTGQFVLSDYLKEDGALKKRAKAAAPLWGYLQKAALLYGAAILLYLPLGIYAGHYKELNVGTAFRMLLFDGTFYHLWYFPGLILGILLLMVLGRFCSVKVTGIVVSLLYLLGLLGDSYWGLTSQIPGAADVYEWCFQVLFGYTRNGLFFAPLFLWMGATAYREDRGKTVGPSVGGIRADAVGLGISLVSMTIEGFLLRYAEWQRHDSMYLSLPLCMFFLYQLLLKVTWETPLICRTAATWMYLLHPGMIVIVRGLPFGNVIAKNSLVFYGVVLLLSGCAAWMTAYLLRWVLGHRFRREQRKSRGGELFSRARAWIEVDKEALRQNVAALKALLPENCQLMPAVKADAYGHGAVLIARELNRIGIYAFCVACVAEGVSLRKNGIKGEILVLGYTHPREFELLHRYCLTQTVVDYDYAQLLNQCEKKVRVHVGIDTGMHRLGERSDHEERLAEICRMEHLDIQGAFTHLCADDTNNPKDVEFTQKQAKEFYRIVKKWKEQGFSCPKVHLLASYGVLNYPQLAGDYARVGIALYGVRSAKTDYDRSGIRLFPVLSLKARVASVRELGPGEAAGYGLAFVAQSSMRIATLAIGYGDGLPRALSCGGGSVLIHGKRARILGRICMDQTLVDVTDIPEAAAGDIAVLIGTSGEEEITAYELAEAGDTITNEILSRLGGRLWRVGVGGR